MNLDYLPETFDGKVDHVIEECAEVTKALLKCRRFGWHPHTVHFPDGPRDYNNLAKLREELRDLHTALSRAEIAIDVAEKMGTFPEPRP